MSENNHYFKQLSWYHQNADRHTAESILMLNGSEGTFLMRPGGKENEAVISVKSSNCVRHWHVKIEGGKVLFGAETFASWHRFLAHIENQPVLSNKSGITVVLKCSYPCNVDEPHFYETAIIHAEAGKTGNDIQNENLAVGSKSGSLTKMGDIRKNWKTRWFTLDHNLLRYYKDRSNINRPIRTLDLSDCDECEFDNSMGKSNCFRLRFSWRTFYMYSSTSQDAEDWVKLIKWKLANKRPSV